MKLVGAMSEGAREKIEGVVVQPKAGSGAISFVFGKPKLRCGPAAGEKTTGSCRLLPTDPNSFFSYSCSCWWAPALIKYGWIQKDGVQ